MYRFLSLKFRAFISLLGLCMAWTSAVAAPWLDPGDPRARFAIQKLVDQSRVNVLVTTWPIAWGEIANGVSGSKADGEMTGMPQAYLTFEQRHLAKDPFRGELSLYGQHKFQATNGFERYAEGETNAALILQAQGRYWATGLEASHVGHPEANDNAFRFDGSYVAAAWDNWILGAGAIRRWWGPGWHHSLMLSNNSRPAAGIWLSRNISEAPDTPVLSSIGPWHVTLFAGENQSNRTVSEGRLGTVRFAFRPLAELEVGLSHSVIDERDKQINQPDDKRQLSSIDFRLGQALGQQTSSVYAQVQEENGPHHEDEALWLLGVDWTNTAFNGDQQWYLEYANALVGVGGVLPELNATTTVNDGLGDQRSLVQSFNTAGESVTLGVYHFFKHGPLFSVALSMISEEIGDGGDDPSPSLIEDSIIAKFGYEQQVLNGWLRLQASVSDEKQRYSRTETSRFGISARWTYRF